MKLKALFRNAVAEFRSRDVLFAVAGGFAMDLYRREPRLTMDVDFAVMTKRGDTSVAVQILERLGLHAGLIREADLAGGPMFAIRRKSTPPCMVVGRPEGNSSGEGVDILLPAIPWVKLALERAQANMVDFGFGAVPALTVEDAILSKLHALKRLRAKDLDDLQSIFEAGQEIDIAYLAGQIHELKIAVPRQAEPFLPDRIVKLCRDAVR